MKIVDIDIETKLIIKFKYKEKPYSLIVQVVAKNNNYIIIPSILENDVVVDPSALVDVEIIYTVKEGIFCFENVKLDASTYQKMRVYLVGSDEDVTRINRRGAYRVFIGELVKLNTIADNGKKKEIEGILKNISLTGMGIILKQEFELGTTISILYEFEGVYFHLVGKVIRKEKIDRYRAFSYGCMFKDPNNSINRIIIQKQIRNKNEATEEREGILPKR